METKKALIYCRVSTKKQDTDGSGLSSQEQRCKEYAIAHNLQVEQVFHDAFSGAGDFMKRPAMRQLLEYVDNNSKTIYVVIFDDLKRFARDTVFHIKLRQAFRVRNLTPKCLNFNLEDTPEGEFIETIIAAQGQLEREQNRRQVFQKMKARFELGIYCIGGQKLIGYTFEKSKLYGGKILTIDTNKVEYIREAFEGFASGKYFHLIDVAKYFVKNNVIENKKKIRDDTIKFMLTNILYTGYVEYPRWNVKRIKGVHDPIISLELFEKVQIRLDNKLPVFTGKKMDEDFPLRGGLVNCMHCQKTLTGSWSKGRSQKYPFYRCMGKNCPYRTKSIKQNKIHIAFEEILKSLKPNEDTIFVANELIKIEIDKRNAEMESYLNNIKNEFREVRDRKSNLIHLISKTSNDVMVQLYEEQINELHKQEISLTEKINNPDRLTRELLEPAIQDAYETIHSPYIYWQTKGIKQKRLMVKTIFKTILQYDLITEFGTAKKCSYIRFFDDIESKIAQNFVIVHKGVKKLNQEVQFADITNLSLEEVVQSIQEIAQLKNPQNL